MPEQREQRGNTMSEETQAKAPAAADAPPTPQASSGPGPGSGSGPSSGPRGAGRPGGGPGGRGKFFRRKKVCKFCTEKIDGDSLPRRKAAAGICGRARQDCAAAVDRCLHYASAPFDPRHQAGTEHRAAAVCNQALERFQSSIRSRLRFLAAWPASRASCLNGKSVFGAADRVPHDKDLESFPWK